MKSASDVSILFVDDEPYMLSSLRRFLRKEPYQSLFADSGRQALDILATQPIDIIVSDLRMPEMDGLSLLKRVKSDHPGVLRLILSATRDMEHTIAAINTGEVYRFMGKPLDPEVFKRVLRDTVDHHLLIAGRRETMAEIEKRLLQSCPPRDLYGADIAALMIPSGQLNGDFADYFVYSPQQVDILVGDVMGKGVQSALVAAAIKHQFAKSLAVFDCHVTPRMSCPHLSHDNAHFAKVVSGVQAACIEDLLELEMFCTLDFARLDLLTGRLHLFDLGHCPVIHFHAETGDFTLLKSNNMALGMVKEPEYHAVTASVNPGDALLFHTDGVTETQSVAGEMFGVERLAEKVRANHHLPAAQLIETIRTEVAVFSGRGRFDDDFTCIAVRIESV
ncbi:MAG: SpoIIE family protein phosphatase [Desulfobacterales bacterium]|nr:SpoIIE family protein phosphatase [Desulfobacterales bacterium]